MPLLSKQTFLNNRNKDMTIPLDTYSYDSERHWAPVLYADQSQVLTLAIQQDPGLTRVAT